MAIDKLYFGHYQVGALVRNIEEVLAKYMTIQF